MSVNIIKVNRGDTFSFDLDIIDDNNAGKYLLTKNDVLYFALMYPHQRFEDALLVKGYTTEDLDEKSSNIVVNIEPNDTRNLEPGIYYYTVKLQRGGTLEVVDDLDEPEEVRTIIERTKFIINE